MSEEHSPDEATEESSAADMFRRRFMEAAAATAIGTTATASSVSAAPGDVAFAVNAGGSSYTAGDGTTYQADTSYSGGAAASFSDSISGTSDDALFQSERYGDFSYDVSVANGTYDVELHFAEGYWNSSGSRVFDIAVEGTTEVSGLDVYAEVGHDAAHVQTISGVDVTDRTLNVSFTGQTDNPKVSAVKVVEAGSGDGGDGGDGTQSPYGGSAWPIPGRVEAEDYDTGGEGTAYHDTTGGNSGSTYRSDDVDLESASEGGYNVGWIQSGEWLEYTVDVGSGGDYDVEARVSSASAGGGLSLSVDGTQQASASFGATGGWQSWSTVSLGTVALSAGQHVLRVTADQSDWNFNFLELTSSDDDNGGGGDPQFPDDPGNLDGRSWANHWFDHFDQSSLDTSVWVDQTGNGHDYGVPGWGNGELQYYSTDNRWLDGNSNLVIECREEQTSDEHGTYDYTSAKLVTQDNFDFQYGRVDIRSRLVQDQGLWPAHWMMPAGETTWPDDGEIDIMELIGQEPSTTHGTVHGPNYSGGGSIGGGYTLDSGVFADAFHVFSCIWDPDEIKWYVDGNHFFTVTRAEVENDGNEWPFDDGSFWLLLNLAVGGAWPGPPDSSTTFPQQMHIDYVRVMKPE